MVRFIKDSILPLVEWNCPICKEIVITRFYMRKLQQMIRCPQCNEGKLIITKKKDKLNLKQKKKEK